MPKSRYSNLTRILSQRDTKVVVSLGGGGIRMFAHPAVFRFLESIAAQRHISEIWGAGGGAIIGLLYSIGMSPDRIEEEGRKFLRSQNRFRLVPSVFSIVKKVVTEAFASDEEQSLHKGFVDIQALLQELVGATLKKGKQKYPFYCIAYNIETNQTDILTPCKSPSSLYDGWLYQTNPMDAIVASSALPILFVPKAIADKSGRRIYADGALTEEVPTASIYRKWLRDRETGMEKRKRLLIIGVNLNPPFFSSLGFLRRRLIQKLPGFQYMLMSMQCADFMRKARTEAQKRILAENPDVELWELNLEMINGGFLDVQIIPKVIETAARCFPYQFSRINSTLMA